jgi:hypothetical protein
LKKELIVRHIIKIQIPAGLSITKIMSAQILPVGVAWFTENTLTVIK